LLNYRYLLYASYARLFHSESMIHNKQLYTKIIKRYKSIL